VNWRLRKDAAGSGANGDLNAHHVDMARFLCGEIGEVVGMKKTFITERPAEGRSAGLTATAGEGTERVTVDDATLFLAKFSNGALGSFEATRMAPGRKNFNRVEINGSKGSLVFNFEEMNVLQFYNCADPAGRQGFRQIMATEGVHPSAGNWCRRGTCWAMSTFVHAVYELMGSTKATIMADFRGSVRGGAGCG
jgi:predicted dehydrogenase